jgi:hypothetical protein
MPPSSVSLAERTVPISSYFVATSLVGQVPSRGSLACRSRLHIVASVLLPEHAGSITAPSLAEALLQDLSGP